MRISGFYNGNQMRKLEIPSYTIAGRDESLSRLIYEAPSEKDSYTKEDALLKQYMKQYRTDVKIVDGTIINNSDTPIRLVIRDDVTADELKNYAQFLSKAEKTKDIDWFGLKNDLSNMETGLHNADKLNNKVDYLTSRYAYLKDYIQNSFTGTEQEQNLAQLENIYQKSKETLASSYSDAVGSFYESFGSSDEKEKMYQSMLSGIDKRVSEYEDILKNGGDYSDIKNPDEEWLRTDDSYMAARLRDYASTQNVELSTPDNPRNINSTYSLRDLAVAGIFAAESSQQYNSIEMNQFPDDEIRIGLDLALQTMKTDSLIKKTGIGTDMSALIKNTAHVYMNQYLNRLNENLANAAASYNVPGAKRSLDLDAVNSIYGYTLDQYQDSDDIKASFQKGAERAKSDFYSQYSNKGGSYSEKIHWDQFFNVPQYATNAKELSYYEKYNVLIDRFTDSLKTGTTGSIELLFAPGGRTLTERFSYSAVDLYI
ncbi:hypothetical protein ACOAOT_20225 [Lacrimispora sp. AGF001]|uniref:hypothetical protein n=1 Tax=Lacrimispora sp. AGF001 TaxID=3401631 RepID=UPI003B4281B0